MMQTARILRGFATTAGQWLNPGLLVQAPANTLRVWADAGLAEPLTATQKVAVATPDIAAAPVAAKPKRSKTA